VDEEAKEGFIFPSPFSSNNFPMSLMAFVVEAAAKTNKGFGSPANDWGLKLTRNSIE
jgi:hypothetical protein